MERQELYNQALVNLIVAIAERRGFANRAAHPPMRQLTEADLMARAEATRVRVIRVLASPGMEGIAERCILDGCTIEEARAVMLAEYNRRHPKMADVTDDALFRALGGY